MNKQGKQQWNKHTALDGQCDGAVCVCADLEKLRPYSQEVKDSIAEKEVFSPSMLSFLVRCSRMMMLNAELKSINSILM